MTSGIPDAEIRARSNGHVPSASRATDRRASSTPDISVVMPVFNGRPYLKQAIASILAQTHTAFELLIVDDGSTDGSLEIAEHFAERDPRVRVIRQDHEGNYPARNRGMNEARARYIAAMDADDVALPERLQKQYEFLESHPEFVLIGSQVLQVDPDGAPIGPMNGLHTSPDEVDAALMDKKWAIVQSTVTMRRTDVMALGGYREQFRTCGDHDLWIRLAERGRIGNLPEVLIQYRLHYKSLTHNQSDQHRNLSIIQRDARLRRGLPALPDTEIAPVKDRGPLTLRERRLLHIRWAQRAWQNGYRRSALKNLFDSFRLSPRDTLSDAARSAARRIGISPRDKQLEAA